MGIIFCGEASKSNNDEDLRQRLVDSGVLYHTTYTNKNITNVEECRIDVTVINGQKMNCELKGTVDMKL